MDFLKKNFDIIFIVLIATIVYFILFGFKSLDLFNINFPLRGYGNIAYKFSFVGGFMDLSEHYLGSVLYRLDNFHPLIFFNQNIGFPYGTSILNTDSIPILAIIFKILYKTFGLSPYTQYFGLWTLLCFILQGVFSILIFRELKFSKINSILASCFMIISPIMIVRMFEHSALAAHFLILMGLYLYIKNLSVLKREIYWAINFLLVLLIQPNFLPMCFGIFCADYMKRIFITKEINLKRFLIYCAIMGVSFPAFIFGTGLLTDSSVSSWGYELFSMNLNSFFNPLHMSVFFKTLPTGTIGQYEGGAYLGLGIILLLLISLIAFFRSKIKINFKNNTPLILALLLLLIFAISNDVYFGKTLIFHYPLSDSIYKMFNIFRTSGRMCWPLWYVLFILGTFVLNKACSKKKFTIILSVILFVQIIDLIPLFFIKHQFVRSCSNEQYKTILGNPKWYNGEYAKKYDGITILEKEIKPATAYFTFYWFWAAQNRKNVNFGYVCRIPKGILEDVERDIKYLLNGEIYDKSRIYVINQELYLKLQEASKTNPKVGEILNKIHPQIPEYNYVLTP